MAEPINLKMVFPRLYPILPNSVDLDIKLTTDDSPVEGSFCGDLIIFYGHDVGSTYELISERERRELNLSKSELNEIAVQNLTDTEKEIRLHRAEHFSFIICDGNLEASLILHQGIWDYLAEQIGNDLIVSVPARDLLLISTTKPIEVAALKKKTNELLEKVYRPLSGMLYQRIGNGWEVYEP